jgi:hypothetical protein
MTEQELAAKGRQPNQQCSKCKREIKQAFNEYTDNFQYDETFRKYRDHDDDYYFCNECYESLMKQLKENRDKIFKEFKKK